MPPVTPCSTTATLGNILAQTDCDALVNSANPRLIAGGGVCGAIHAAAGPELERCSKALAPLAVGDAVITPAFNLSAAPSRIRHVIHTRGPVYHLDQDPPGNLARALRSAIDLAETHGLQRIAVPAISMGVYGYPAEAAVPILVRTALDAARTLQSVAEIRFVVTQKPLFDLFSAALRSRSR